MKKSTGLYFTLMPFLIVAMQMIKPIKLWESLVLFVMLDIGCKGLIKEWKYEFT